MGGNGSFINLRFGMQPSFAKGTRMQKIEVEIPKKINNQSVKASAGFGKKNQN